MYSPSEAVWLNQIMEMAEEFARRPSIDAELRLAVPEGWSIELDEHGRLAAWRAGVPVLVSLTTWMSYPPMPEMYEWSVSQSDGVAVLSFTRIV